MKHVTLDEVAARVRANKTIGIGQATHLLRQLPPDDLARVAAGLSLVEHAEQMGKYGDKNTAFEVLGYEGEDRKVAERVFEAVQQDDLTASLIQRMGGPDCDRPLPEMTSRDFVEAAYAAHNEEN